ncbi:MAG: hypothetical protein M1834_007540 [Cirrosporium novae-zelandiae]|nr:MAG: hypothetical protein M1834_007540 [Cirrosporium novae-zelandiae]
MPRSHHDPRRHICPHCKKSFKHRRYITEHLQKNRCNQRGTWPSYTIDDGSTNFDEGLISQELPDFSFKALPQSQSHPIRTETSHRGQEDPENATSSLEHSSPTPTYDMAKEDYVTFSTNLPMSPTHVGTLSNLAKPSYSGNIGHYPLATLIDTYVSNDYLQGSTDLSTGMKRFDSSTNGLTDLFVDMEGSSAIPDGWNKLSASMKRI